MAESRRTFLKQSAATLAGASLAGRATEAVAASATGAGAVRSPEILRGVAEVVLPGELGPDGRERAVRAFERWSEGLVPVAELSHPYVVPEIRYSGPDPRPGWAAQLDGLDKESRGRHGAPFAELEAAARRDILARPLSRAPAELGPPQDADHVATALMAHFFRLGDRRRPLLRSRHPQASVPKLG